MLIKLCMTNVKSYYRFVNHFHVINGLFTTDCTASVILFKWFQVNINKTYYCANLIIKYAFELEFGVVP